MKGISKHTVMKHLKKVQACHEIYKQMSDSELQNEFNEVTCKAKSRDQDLRSLIAPVFAIVKEAIYRKLGITPYQEQMISAIAMSNGCISEMKTGEGKTVASVFVSVLFSIDMQIHVVTVNDYLAERDFMKMLPVYRFLNISCSLNVGEGNKDDIYRSRVIFTAANSLIFDYLSEKIKARKIENFKGLISLEAAILDEIDFILLDNANSNFSVSIGSGKPFVHLGLYRLMRIAFKDFVGGEINNRFSYCINEECIKAVDFIYSLSDKSIQITDGGFKKIERIFCIKDLTSHLTIYKAALHTIEAHVFYKKDKNYIVRDNRICLINEANGRVMHNSYKEEGLQQAIEIKEDLGVNGVNPQEISMTFQLFFNKYKIIMGMSGTLQGAEEEFADIYDLQTYIIPLHRSSLRKDLKDIVYKTAAEKFENFYSMLRQYHLNRQPILIISECELEAVGIYAELTERNYAPQLLINQTGEAEEKVVKRAGVNGAITITTNMAGRGTDVIIDNTAIDKGGLVVIALAKFNSIRFDNQVKGRAGRQGLPGITITLSSLEDSIWTNVCQYRYESLLSIDDDNFYLEKIQKMLRKELLGLQKRADKNMYSLRKVNYLLDMHINQYKSFIYEFAQTVYNLQQFKLLIDTYINQELIKSLKALEAVNESDHKRLNLFKACLIEIMHSRIDLFGEKLAIALFRRVLDLTIDQTIQDTLIQLNNTKIDIMARTSDCKKSEIEFINDTKQIIDNYLTYIFIKSSELFISAKLFNE